MRELGGEVCEGGEENMRVESLVASMVDQLVCFPSVQPFLERVRCLSY